MKILLVHNRYTHRGGEDVVFEQERDLLRSRGHDVVEYVRSNNEIGGPSAMLVASTLWSQDTYREALALMREKRPDILHVHNTLPLISPAIYYAAAKASVPVVQTLHNYRLLCANGLLLRDSRICEDCVGKALPLAGVRHRCYRGNAGATATVAALVALHRVLGTWERRVARYIALCEFARSKFVAAGLPADRVVVKSNFAPDRCGHSLDKYDRSGALFAGRLSREKGADVLLAAWRDLDIDIELAVAGGGELESELRASATSRVTFCGTLSVDELALQMKRSAFLVVPSICYETFGMVVPEAFCAGLPVISSRLGALAELIDDGETGLLFTAGDSADLARKVRWAYEHPEQMAAMGQRARQTYERRYTADVAYRRLLEVYDQAKQVGSS